MSSTGALKRKLQEEAAVVFKKDGDYWVAMVDGGIIASHKYQGDCVQLAARELGE